MGHPAVVVVPMVCGYTGIGEVLLLFLENASQLWDLE